MDLSHRDMRSGAQSYKRDRNHAQKWHNGAREMPGVRSLYFPALTLTPDELPAKYRPQKQSLSSGQPKTHANLNPRTSIRRNIFDNDGVKGRLARKIDAVVDARLTADRDVQRRSRPHTLDHEAAAPRPHLNNTSPAVHTVPAWAVHNGALYNFETSGPAAAATRRSRPLGLGDMVDRAERQWVSDQTARIVAGEYEVLDGEGETTSLRTRTKRTGHARAGRPVAPKHVPYDDDDDFEFI